MWAKCEVCRIKDEEYTKYLIDEEEPCIIRLPYLTGEEIKGLKLTGCPFHDHGKTNEDKHVACWIPIEKDEVDEITKED